MPISHVEIDLSPACERSAASGNAARSGPVCEILSPGMEPMRSRIGASSAWATRTSAAKHRPGCEQGSRVVSNGTVHTGQPSAEPWRRNLRGESDLDVPRGDDWWTGLPPVHGSCPGVDACGVIRGQPLPVLTRSTREEVLAYFENGWTITETLFAGLVGEEAFVRPPWHDLRHPMVFYYAHPAALYVNKLRIAGALDGAVNADAGVLAGVAS
jgi:hypothetical protein